MNNRHAFHLYDAGIAKLYKTIIWTERGRKLKKECESVYE